MKLWNIKPKTPLIILCCICLALLVATPNNARFISSAFAQTEMIVVRGNGDWPPYEMTQDEGLTGLHIELVKTVASSMGVTVFFESYPWLRAMEMVKTGQADAITYVAKNQERSQYIHFLESNVLSGTTHLLIKHKTREDISFTGNINELEPYSIIHMTGYTFGDTFDHAENLNKTPMKSVDQIVKLVAKERYDLGIISQSDLQGLRLEAEIHDIEFLAPPLYSTAVYIGFSKEKASYNFVEEFSAAMKAFKKTTEYQQLLRKYNL